MKKELILASQCGAILGKWILTVERNSVDPDFSKKVTEGILRTSQPLYLYSIKPIFVEQTKIVESANGVKSVEFNDNPKLRLPLAGIDDITAIIPKATSDAVRKAIIKSEANGETTIFVDYPNLVKEVTALNTESRAILSAFISEQMKFVKTFEDANMAEILACKQKMADEGIDVSKILG